MLCRPGGRFTHGASRQHPHQDHRGELRGFRTGTGHSGERGAEVRRHARLHSAGARRGTAAARPPRRRTRGRSAAPRRRGGGAGGQAHLGTLCVPRRRKGSGMTDQVIHPDGLPRCPWPRLDPLYVRYHDEEWGVPEYDDRALYEKFVLDGFQAGLSWITILRKRENFRRAFDNFEPALIARYTPRKIEKLMKDAGIVRNRMKIEGTVASAKSYLKIMDEGPGFSKFLGDFVEGKPKVNKFKTTASVPASTPLSIKISKELAARGFKFVGPTIVYAFMQATGMVNDHLVTCFCYASCAGKQRAPRLKVK